LKKELFSIKPETLPASAGRGKSKQLLRYLLWLGVAGTAYANRRHFGLTTAWLPHLLGNTVSLLLPELYTLARRLFLPAPNGRPSSWGALQRSFEQLVPENPDYIDYVAPAALAYIVSHPNFNIYRGEMGELSFLGFGLDSLPHGATAYGLSNLVYDTVETVEAQAPPETALHPPANWLARRKHLAAGGVLTLLSFLYETGEYIIHRSELKARNNDPSQINLVWGVKDTIFDLLSNIIGWAIAAWRRSVKPAP
jgi:hypothetical protein